MTRKKLCMDKENNSKETSLPFQRKICILPNFEGRNICFLPNFEGKSVYTDTISMSGSFESARVATVRTLFMSHQ